MVNAKITMFAKIALNMIPSVPKEAVVIMKNLKFDVSKLFVFLLTMYREKLKEMSPDVYELVLRITTQLIIAYETDEKFRKNFNEMIDPIVMAYAEKRNEKL